MQRTLALRNVSINSMLATFAVICALASGAAGGYLLRGQVLSAVTTAAQPPITAQSKHVAPPVDFPEGNVYVPDAADRAAAHAANAAGSGDKFSSRTGD